MIEGYVTQPYSHEQPTVKYALTMNYGTAYLIACALRYYTANHKQRELDEIHGQNSAQVRTDEMLRVLNALGVVA